MAKKNDGQLAMPWAHVSEPEIKPIPVIHHGKIAHVALDAPLDRVYSYLVLPEMADKIRPGMIVEVPVTKFNRRYKAFVLKITEKEWPSGLKPILSIVDDRVLFSEKLLELGLWMADYYVSAAGQALASAIPSVIVKSAGKALRVKPFIKEFPRVEPTFSFTEDQSRVMAQIEQILKAGKFSVMMMHGVTASGKTELYVKAIQEVLAKGQGAIYLVPEIALTAQMIQRLGQRFDKVAVLHSGLTESQRRATWEAVQNGQVNVVVGTRSAVFAPIPNLGLIVVDEEQEPSFKNLQAPRFNTRDLAIKRSQLQDIPIILGSATPSLESFHNSKTNPSWVYLSLPKRVANLPLPPVLLVDMLQEGFERKGIHLVSRCMEEKIKTTLDRGKQVMLLMNRRGFAGYIFCPSCKYILTCPSCGTRMVYHKSSGKAQCHHCSVKVVVPEKCDRCGHKMNKFGLGTERVEDELTRKFPDVKLARMDQDSMNRPADYEETLKNFAEGKTQILIGTQMIAKGLDFPNVSLVGVLSADMALSLPDFRAGERTFQLLAQVAGRAGRADYTGMVVVQSFNLQDPAIQASLNHDYESYAQHELSVRRKLGLPPFSRMTRIIVQHLKVTQVKEIASEIAKHLNDMARTVKGVQIIGPNPCVMGRLRNRYRYQILIKCPNAIVMRDYLAKARSDKSFRLMRKEVLIDVDPVDLL